MIRKVLWTGLGLLYALALGGCPSGPTEADMAGCAVRSGGPAITVREVADCAVDRAERHDSSTSGSHQDGESAHH